MDKWQTLDELGKILTYVLKEGRYLDNDTSNAILLAKNLVNQLKSLMMKEVQRSL